MGDSDDENFVTFGVALDPLDEDNIPRKKTITIEDQFAYDEQGRRRFHGAFTGGFSAGYFNTVGTRDGWRPQQFKSSRGSKAEGISQRPEDFMDEEDTSQFGIAPKGIRATSDYADHTSRGTKRERVNHASDGPIPGIPVLKELLKPVKETVGIMLLKKMGWKPGQGVGSRVTKSEKSKMKRQNEKIRASQQQFEKSVPGSNSEDSEDDCGDITFAPDDYEPFRCNPKDNFFGIGYSGLDRRNILSGHVNLFDIPAFSVQDKNKKLSIHGQAFGVGAFEADDEDIYEREDMSRYDFSLGPERKTKSRWSDQSTSKNQRNNCLEGFSPAKNQLQRKKIFAPPELPKDFVPVHAVRKSRFYPPIESVPRTMENGKRKDLTAVDRARILENTHGVSNSLHPQPNAIPSVASNIVTRTLNLHGKQQIQERQKLENQQSKITASWMEKLSTKNFIKGGIVGSQEESTGSLKKLEEFKDSSVSESQTSADFSRSEEETPVRQTTVKPFLHDPDKQRRFEQYLVFLKNGEKSKLESIQTLSMTEWDREHERTEFEQAARLFEQPSDELANKFTLASNFSSDVKSTKSNVVDTMKDAVKMKMFGKLTRERLEWKPASIVCKRFNIPEPKVGCAIDVTKKPTKFSVFDSIDWSNSTKFSKATDTAMKAMDEISIRKNENEDSNVEPQSDIDVTFCEPRVGPVSEKMRSFEASYEKVFGKEVQETPAARSTDSIKQNSQSVDNKVDLTKDLEIIDKSPVIEEDITGPRTVSKSKSEEKKDLFKAIFLSSSEESDSDPEESVDSEALKSVLIGKLPSEVNVNRNTSPPRGIFAKVDFDNLLMNPKGNEQTNESVDKGETLNSTSCSEVPIASDKDRENTGAISPEILGLPDMYGPALPARLIKTENPTTTEASSSQILKPVFRSVVVQKVTVDSKTSGKWVERGKVKKSKKEKKKHKHKEHKSSKHKRKSKRERRSS